MEPIQSTDTETLRNENPEFLINFFTNVTNFFMTYGWFCFFVFVSFLCVLHKCRHYIEQYWNRKAEEEYAAKYHKNPDLYQARLIAIEESRKRMQEKHDQMAVEFQLKMEEKEKRKRQEFLEKHAGGQGAGAGVRLGTGKSEDDKQDSGKKSFKPEYNPLMGGSSGSSYRAPKRSACGGGGCGK